MKVRMTVTVDLHNSVDRESVGDHVARAVAYWGGQYHPEDPLFPYNIKEVRVRGKDFEIFERLHDE